MTTSATSTINEHMKWVMGYISRSEGRVPNTWVAEYRLRHLIQANLIDPGAGQRFLDDHGLTDFHWQMTWADDFEMPDDMLLDRLVNTQGYIFFIHGWTGNYLIWEDLPGMAVLSNRLIVSVEVDHNGFGGSLLVDTTPALDTCNPPAAMRTMEGWIDLMKFRRQPGEPRNKVMTLVGHSMGGATLFYMNPIVWNYGELARMAIAPALLLEDESHRFFYTTLGLGIGILQRLPVLEFMERFIKPSMLNTLVAGATDEVKHMHSQQYQETPRGITGATFMAMGLLDNHEIARNFELMRVMLGHRDPLVGLVPMMDLLGKLEFPAANIHVVPGTHYMFSVGRETPMNAYQHAQNREIIVDDILALHQKALEMQKRGPIYGGKRRKAQV
jgi:hypothetical protein